MPRKNKSPSNDYRTIFDPASDVVCYLVHAVEYMLHMASPEVRETMERDFPDRVAENNFHTAANGFATLVLGLQKAETLFAPVRQQIRELYTTPPEPMGDVSGPSYHDMGLRFAEAVFNHLQMAADFPGIWTMPLRGVKDEHIRKRAIEIGERAG